MVDEEVRALRRGEMCCTTACLQGDEEDWDTADGCRGGTLNGAVARLGDRKVLGMRDLGECLEVLRSGGVGQK